MKTIGIIRNRGQLTIPDRIRKIATWATPMSAVSIAVVTPNEIVIRPQETRTNWEELWGGIKKVRAIKGSGNIVSATQVIEQDRLSH